MRTANIECFFAKSNKKYNIKNVTWYCMKEMLNSCRSIHNKNNYL